MNILMEYVPGNSLDAMLKNLGPLPEKVIGTSLLRLRCRTASNGTDVLSSPREVYASIGISIELLPFCGNHSQVIARFAKR